MAQTEVAAKISKASGPISVERNGEILELNQGDTVYATDTISTQKSAIELVFTDGAVANLSPNSTLKIQEFSYDTGEDPAFVLSLARGAMRSLSGKLVELNPDAFKVLTPKATAGIRGTEFVTVVRLDGREQHALLDIDPGHNFVVTSYGGRQISLSISGGSIVIAAGSDTEMSEGAITQEEAAQIIREILGALANDEDVSSDLGSAFEQLQLDASAKAALQAALEKVLDSLDVGEPIILNADDDFATNASDSVDPPSVVVAVVESKTPSGKVFVEISGQDDWFADGDTPTASFTAISHAITITGTNTEESDVRVQISCDVNEVEEGITVIGGHDDITGGLIAFSEITGDAFEVEGSLQAGNDFMVFSGLLSSDIYGDAKDVDSSATITHGSDTIIIGGDVNGSNIYGDDSNYVSALGGNDSIIVTGTVSGASIYGGGGDDSITIGTVNITGSHNSVSGGDGNDHIKITTLQNGGVGGDAGNDTIKVDDFKGGGIVGGDGADTITAHITGSSVEIYVSEGSGADGFEDVVRLTYDVGTNKTVNLYGLEVGVDKLYVDGTSIIVQSSGDYATLDNSLTIYFNPIP